MSTRVVMLTDGWMHPAEQSTALTDLLEGRGASVTVVTQPELIADAFNPAPDIVVANPCWFAMTDDRYSDAQRADFAVQLDATSQAVLEAALDQGIPLLAIHTAVLCFDGWEPWVAALGAEWDWSTSFHPPPTDLTVEPVIPNGFWTKTFSVVDEEYQGLRLVGPANVIARSAAGHPLVWTNDSGPGRVAVSLLGHGPTSLQNPQHQELLHALIDWLEEPHA